MRRWQKDLGALALIVLFYIALEMLFGIGCPFKFLTGISDAGCGMSRAWVAVLHGDFRHAFSFHPLWPLPPLALAAWSLRGHMPKGMYQALMGTMMVAFLVVWIARFFVPDQDIVVFAPWNGVVGRCGRWIYELCKLMLKEGT